MERIHRFLKRAGARTSAEDKSHSAPFGGPPYDPTAIMVSSVEMQAGENGSQAPSRRALQRLEDRRQQDRTLAFFGHTSPPRRQPTSYPEGDIIYHSKNRYIVRHGDTVTKYTTCPHGMGASDYPNEALALRYVKVHTTMRMLGHGQSVVFCIPNEIKNNIMQHQPVSIGSDITVTHVLTWAIRETHFDAKKSAPLWATQASRFYKQDRSRQERVDSQEEYSSTWAKRFLEAEAHSLERRYRPGFSVSSVADLCEGLPDANSEQITNRLGKFGPLNTDMASLHEQQERELSPEAEEERQVERPPRAEALEHQIHPNVRHFVRCGFVNIHQGGFKAAFQTLRDTGTASHANINELPQDLLATEDFARTVKLAPDDQSDLFKRPVQWILSSVFRGRPAAYLVIISQYEAQELLDDIQASEFVTLHLYNPCMNTNNPSLDHLTLYTVPARQCPIRIPRGLTNQLNLFAGQLYFQSFEEYTQICDTLCLAWETVNGDALIEADGFVPPGCAAGSCINNGRYTCSPTKFLHELMAKIRRNNEGIEKTHMGKLLAGKLLNEEDLR